MSSSCPKEEKGGRNGGGGMGREGEKEEGNGGKGNDFSPVLVLLCSL